MSTLLFFSSVPGMAVPGMAQPGRDGLPSLGMYQYIGQEACTYLDYLDLGTGHVLSPVPGAYYSVAVASGRNADLTVPPPGRPWVPGNAGTGGTFAPLVMRRLSVPLEISHGHYPGAACGHCDPEVRDRPPPPRRMPGPDFAPAGQPVRPGLPLAVSHGHYGDAGCRHCDPAARDAVPPPRRMDGPDVSPVDPAAALARGRAHTSALHAAWARGVLKPGEPLSGDDHQRLGCCLGAGVSGGS